MLSYSYRCDYSCGYSEAIPTAILQRPVAIPAAIPAAMAATFSSEKSYLELLASFGSEDLGAMYSAVGSVGNRISWQESMIF